MSLQSSVRLQVLAFIYLNGRLPQDFAKFFTGRCHVALLGASDPDGHRFRCAGQWAVEQAFASDKSEERGHQSDAASGFHFEDEGTDAIACHHDTRFGGDGGEEAL